LGWNNRRGVIRAIEEEFGRAWDEESQFVDVAAGFLVRHPPWCKASPFCSGWTDVGGWFETRPGGRSSP
jgi:hypothetical protein